MSKLSAIVFVPDDTSRTGLSKPLMLTNMMYCPLLRWITEALWKVGVTRFFLVCHDKYLEEARQCFPGGAQVKTADSDSPSDLLHVFLSTNDDDSAVVCITRPVVITSTGANSLASPIGEPEPEQAPFFPHMVIKKTSDKPPPPETGVFMLRGSELMEALDGELDFGSFLNKKGVTGHEDGGAHLVSGIDDIFTLQNEAARDILLGLARSGVNVWDASNCYVSPTVRIEPGTALLPGSIITGDTEISSGCVIGPSSRIDSCKIGSGTSVNASQLFQSTIGSNVNIGPFAYVRPNCDIGDDIKIGDFVEVKNSNIGNGTKISHLTYVGDSDIGRSVNLGCGTVTVNYDGTNKFRTTVQDNAFVGCNTNLIAPVTVFKGAYVAAGSTISNDVPADSLAIARSRQTTKRDWVLKRTGKKQP